jgi:hypothetical protein
VYQGFLILADNFAISTRSRNGHLKKEGKIENIYKMFCHTILDDRKRKETIF